MADSVPLSLLNDFLYCPRRAALKGIEGWRETNEHTVLGDIVHEHADLPGYEHRAGWRLLRALPLFSERLGLLGRADLVEVLPHPASSSSEGIGSGGEGIQSARPVEYKRGRVSRWENDRVQLCAQALCIEEMFDIAVPEGMIFHASSNKRTTVAFDNDLRALTRSAITQLHELLRSGAVPIATLKPQCDGCSLRGVCLPELSEAGLARATRALYET